tara:strand:+ start:3293 stop:5395 length:2103 start_codon:yes stop_codon:yes gene_type:complete
MFKKSLLFFILLTVFNLPMYSQGMWLPNELLEQETNMKSKGMTMSASDIYSINSGSLKDAIVHFGGFCTGEVISDQGLVLTNHHCGYGAIQSHSSVQNDYLKNGFWAESFSEEKPNEGLFVDFIVSIDDVSESIQNFIAKGLSQNEAIDTFLQVNPTIGKGMRSEIKPIYFGNQFIRIISQRYSDVRLVGAPPSLIGKFGADTDNWVWPRHTGDFSFFRIYVSPNGSPAEYSPENIPLKTKNPLTISLEGVNEGDFSLIYGFPGRTSNYLPVNEVSQQIDVLLPIRVELREIILNTWDSAMRINPVVKIQYASKYASVSNGWKKWKGQIEGIDASHGIDTLKKRQERMINYHSANNKNAFVAVDQLEHFNNQTESLENARKSLIYFQEILRNWELLTWSRLANNIVRLSDEDKDLKGALRALIEFEKNYNPELDRRSSRSLVQNWLLAGEKDTLLSVPIDYIRETNSFLQGLFNPALYSSLPIGIAELDANFIADSCRNHLAFDLWPDLLSRYRSLLMKTNKLEKDFQSRMKEWVSLYLSSVDEGKNIFAPDANSTMRVSYGLIGGFSPRDGANYNYNTTTEGILEKYIPGDYEFDLPQNFEIALENREFGRYADKDGQLSVCFIAANHTTGGNSGSPALNSKGHLIGLNFDRLWEGTMSDFYFTTERCRNIMVDVRYIMWVVDKYANANRLIEEIKFAD